MASALEAREVELVDELDDVERWRYDGWLAVGFTDEQASALTFARDENGVFRRADDAKRELLDRGCPHDYAFDLLT